MTFNDLILENDGMIKGPFGGDIKKSLFIPQVEGAYKVLEQGVVINSNIEYGNYFLEKEYVEKKLKRFIVNEGDILITGAGTLGKLYEVPKLNTPAVINQALIRIRLNKNIVDERYFKYYFKFQIINLISGINGDSVIPNLPPLSIIRNTKIQIPDLTLQRQIASVLSALDDKIELNNRINAELEQMAKTLYDYWFVQFDFPTPSPSGKAGMGLPYKSSGGNMVYNDVLKREVPEGWEVKKLENCIDTIIDYRGKTPKKLESDWSTNPDDIIALSAKHVKNGKLINLDEANRVDDKLYKVWMKEELKEGDILLTSEAPCGEFFYLVGKTQFCLSQRLFALRANSKVVNSSYLYFELSSGNGYSQILGKVSGSTVFGIRQDELRTVNILVPPIQLQLQFSNKAISIYKKIRNSDYQNQQLSSLRDWLLPMLMNGQVTVGKNSTAKAYVKTQDEALSIAAEDGAGYKKKGGKK